MRPVSGASVGAVVVMTDSVSSVVASLKTVLSTAPSATHKRHAIKVELYPGNNVVYLVEASHLLVQCLEMVRGISEHLNTSVASASFDYGTEIRRLFVAQSGEIKCSLAGNPSRDARILDGDVTADDERQFFEEPGLVGANSILMKYGMDVSPLFSDSRDEMEVETMSFDVDVVQTYMSDALNRKYGFVKADAPLDWGKTSR